MPASTDLFVPDPVVGAVDADWSLAARELEHDPGAPLNVGWYCADRICLQGHARRPALVWEDHQGHRRTYTFDGLRLRSDAIAQYLRGLGLGPGERICLFLDRVPELYIGFLGILKMGGIAQPLFSAFGDEALWMRLDDAGTAAIITQRKHLAKVRKARERLSALRLVLVVDAGDARLHEGERPLVLESLRPPGRFELHATDADTPSVLHYTSGTTGRPKGALHVHGALVAQYLTAKVVLDLRPDDVYWCNADPGWVTGTSYGIIGPWSNGITQVVLDSGFNSQRWYQFLERHRVTVWYSAPTAIRLLMRDGIDLVRRFDLSS
ncbi:MAG TPA: AMP-binding protein, partial [Gemmatimonadales bacterium]|nr:AMP-binding protein [Gemmatimonadales bacterium]